MGGGGHFAGGVMFKILIGFVGSFSDKGALHVPGGGGSF